MRTLAAVLVELGRPLELWELEIPALKAGQVLVELAYTGVCHTQLLEARGRRGPDPFLPHCLGHEASGWVREVGAGVSRVKVDQPVVCSWIKSAGIDVPGTVYAGPSGPVNSGAITTFSRFSVISENRLTPLGPEVPLDQAVLLGCAVPTGFGAVTNTLRPKPGQSLAVFGVGGVGMCALLAAALAGCQPLIAIDLVESKLELARRFGATHTVRAEPGVDPVGALTGVVPGGLDFAVEATGRVQVMESAIRCLRNQGGAVVVVGNAPHGECLALDPKQLNLGKQVRGTWGGDNLPEVDFPRYRRLLEGGRIPAAEMLAGGYRLETINQALDDLESGRVLRPLVQLAGA